MTSPHFLEFLCDVSKTSCKLAIALWKPSTIDSLLFKEHQKDVHLSYKLLGSCKLVEIVNEHLIIFLSPGITARRSRRRRHLLKNPMSSYEKTPYCIPCSSRSVSDQQSTRSIARRCLGCESHCRTCDGRWIMGYQWISWVNPQLLYKQTIIHVVTCWHKIMEDRSNHSHRFGHGFPNLHLKNLRKKLPIFDQQCFFV